MAGNNDWIVDVLISPKVKADALNKLVKQIQDTLEKSADFKLDPKVITSDVLSGLKEFLKLLSEVNKEVSSLNKVDISSKLAAPIVEAAPTKKRKTPPSKGFADEGVEEASAAAGKEAAKAAAAAAGSVASKAAAEGAKEAFSEAVAGVKTEVRTEAKTAAAAVSMGYEDMLKAIVGAQTEFRNEVMQNITSKILAQKEALSKTADPGAQVVINSKIKDLEDKLTVAAGKPGFDLSSIKRLPDLSLLMERQAKEYSDRIAHSNLGRTTPGGLKEAFSGFTHAQDASFERLRSVISSLDAAVGKNIEGRATLVARSIHNIEELSLRGESRVLVGSGEVGRLKSVVSDITKTKLREVIGSLYNSLLEAKKSLEEAVSSGAGKEIVSGKTRELSRITSEIYDVFNVIERGPRAFNINYEDVVGGLPKGGGAGGGKPPGHGKAMRMREAEFLASEYSSLLSRLEPTQYALNAFKKVTDFENIPDIAERTKAAFAELWPAMKEGSTVFRNNMAAVIKAMQLAGTSGLVDSKSIEDSTKTLDSFYKSYTKMQEQIAGVPSRRGGNIHIVDMDNIIGPGNTRAAVYNAVDKIRRDIASAADIQKGVRIPVSISYEDASGQINKVALTFQKLGKSIDDVRVRAARLDLDRTLGQNMQIAFQRVSMWGSASTLVYGGMEALRNSLQVMTSTEVGLVNLSKVMSESDINMTKFSEDVRSFASSSAKEFGTSIKNVYEGMAIYAQQGMQLSDVMSMTRASLLAANVAQISQAEASESLTAATRQFGLEASKAIEIVDMWNEVSNRNAISVKAMADATKKAGSAAATVGIQYEQFLGMVTAIGTATRQPGKEIGTSLKFLFQRTLRPETQKSLAKLGIETKDIEGNFKGFMPVLTDIADKWGTLTRSQQLAIAQAMGGALQYNVFLTLMRNFDTAIKATNDAINSQGSAFTENQKMMDTAAKKFEQARASLHTLYVEAGDNFLPVIKGITDSASVMLKAFGEMPTVIKAAAGALAIGAIGAARFGYNIDMALSAMANGPSNAGLASAIYGGFRGRGKSEEEIGTIEKNLVLTPVQRQGKMIDDFGKSATSAAVAFGALGGSIVDVNGKVVTNVSNMSKLEMAIRNYGVTTKDSTEAARIGFASLNSPISSAILALTQLGKFLPMFLVSAVSKVTTFTLGVFGMANAATAAGAAFAKLNGLIAGLGTGWSFALLIASALVAVKAVKELYGWLTKTDGYSFGEGKKLEKNTEFTQNLATEEQKIKLLKQQVGYMDSVALRNKKIAKATEESSDGFQPLLESMRAAEAEKQAGIFALKVQPGAIQSMDEFGNVTLKTGQAIRDLTEAVVENQAAIVATERTKLSAAYGKDAISRYAALQLSLNRVREAAPAYDAEVELLGGAGTAYGKAGSSALRYTEDIKEVTAQQVGLSEALKNVIENIKRFPKETPISSYMGALTDPNVKNALDMYTRMSAGPFVKQGLYAPKAADLMNQLYMQKKAGSASKYIGMTADQTNAFLKEASVKSKEINNVSKDFDEAIKGLKGGEIVTFGPGGIFGLTQARIEVDSQGTLLIKGLNRFDQEISFALSDIRESLSGTKIFDTTKMQRQATESILRVSKYVSGAGAGLLNFPTKLDLGVKFGHELTGVDNVQRYGFVAQQSIQEAAYAQQEYNKALEEYRTRAKGAATESVSREMLGILDQMGRMSSLKTFTVSLMNEVANVGSAFEKAAYDMQKANLADKVESQFALLFGAAGGFAKGVVPELPRTGLELSPAERVAQFSPGSAMAARSLTRTMDSIKNSMIQVETTFGLDIPKMLAEMPANDPARFVNELGEEIKNAQKSTLAAGGDKALTSQLLAINNVASKVTSGAELVSSTIERVARAFGLGGGKEAEPTYNNMPLSNFLKDLSKGKIPYATEKEKSVGKYGEPVQVENYLQKALDSMSKNRYANLPGGGNLNVRGQIYEYLKPYFGKTVKEDKLSEMAREVLGIIRFEATKSDLVLADVARNMRGNERVGRTQPWAADFFGKGVVSSIFGAIDKGLEELPGVGPKYVLSQSQKTVMEKAGEVSNMRKFLYGTDEGKLLESSKALVLDTLRTNKYTGEENKAKIKPEDIKEQNDKVVKAYLESFRAITANAKSIFDASVQKPVSQYQVMKELMDNTNLAASKVYDFANAMDKGIIGVDSFYESTVKLAGINAPISGAAAGVPRFNVDLGKFAEELTPLERVFKSIPNTRGFAAQEMARSEAVKLSESLYKQMQEGILAVRSMVASGTEAPNKNELLSIVGKSQDMFSTLAETLSSVNSNMTPFIDALRNLTELENARKSIEGLVKEVDKFRYLNFKEGFLGENISKSIDMALGRHPLSPTGGVFGQPAGLNKFERQMYELEEKARGGGMSRQELDSQRRKIEFDKEEAVLQYQQTKENEKLTNETSAAERALSILWDAQYKGISGLEPLMESIKSDLSRAGESYETGGKKYYRGVPSLYGAKDEISKVQSQLEAQRFTMQKDIVIQPLLEVNNKMADYLKTISDAVDKEKKSIVGGKYTEGETKEGLEEKINTASGSFTKFFSLMSSAIQEAVKSIDNSGVKQSFDAFGTAANIFSDMTKSFSEGVVNFNSSIDKFSAAIMAINAAAEKIKDVVPLGGRSLATADTGLGTSVFTEAHNTGGVVRGPSGIDRVNTFAESGSFVINKNAVDKFGSGNLAKMFMGYSSGGKVSPVRLTAGEFVVPRRYVKGRLSELNAINSGNVPGKFSGGYFDMEDFIELSRQAEKAVIPQAELGGGYLKTKNQVYDMSDLYGGPGGLPLSSEGEGYITAGGRKYSIDKTGRISVNGIAERAPGYLEKSGAVAPVAKQKYTKEDAADLLLGGNRLIKGVSDLFTGKPKMGSVAQLLDKAYLKSLYNNKPTGYESTPTQPDEEVNGVDLFWKTIKNFRAQELENAGKDSKFVRAGRTVIETAGGVKNLPQFIGKSLTTAPGRENPFTALLAESYANFKGEPVWGIEPNREGASLLYALHGRQFQSRFGGGKDYGGYKFTVENLSRLATNALIATTGVGAAKKPIAGKMPQRQPKLTLPEDFSRLSKEMGVGDVPAYSSFDLVGYRGGKLSNLRPYAESLKDIDLGVRKPSLGGMSATGSKYSAGQLRKDTRAASISEASVAEYLASETGGPAIIKSMDMLEKAAASSPFAAMPAAAESGFLSGRAGSYMAKGAGVGALLGGVGWGVLGSLLEGTFGLGPVLAGVAAGSVGGGALMAALKMGVGGIRLGSKLGTGVGQLARKLFIPGEGASAVGTSVSGGSRLGGLGSKMGEKFGNIGKMFAGAGGKLVELKDYLTSPKSQMGFADIGIGGGGKSKKSASRWGVVSPEKREINYSNLKFSLGPKITPKQFRTMLNERNAPAGFMELLGSPMEQINALSRSKPGILSFSGPYDKAIKKVGENIIDPNKMGKYRRMALFDLLEEYKISGRDMYSERLSKTYRGLGKRSDLSTKQIDVHPAILGIKESAAANILEIDNLIKDFISGKKMKTSPSYYQSLKGKIKEKAKIFKEAEASGADLFYMYPNIRRYLEEMEATIGGGYALGGLVSGGGTTKSDSILARLSNGEYVLSAKDVENFGGAKNVSKMVSSVRGYKDGGAVGAAEGIVGSMSLKDIIKPAVKEMVSAMVESISESFYDAKKIMSLEDIQRKKEMNAAVANPSVMTGLKNTASVFSEYRSDYEAAKKGKDMLGLVTSGISSVNTGYESGMRKREADLAVTNPMVMKGLKNVASVDANYIPQYEAAKTGSVIYGDLVKSLSSVSAGYTSRAIGPDIEGAAAYEEKKRRERDDYVGLMEEEQNSKKVNTLLGLQGLKTLKSQIGAVNFGLMDYSSAAATAGQAIGNPEEIRNLKKTDPAVYKMASEGQATFDLLNKSMSDIDVGYKKKMSEGTGTTGSDVVSSLKDALPQILKEAIQEAISSSEINISQESVASIEGVIEKIGEITISQDSINAIESAFSSGASSISDAISNALPSLSKMAGPGAAVRSEQVEALEGKIEILKESIQEDKSTLLTNLNERFSTLSSDLLLQARRELTPRINQNTDAIQTIDAEIKGLMTLIQMINAKMSTIQ